MDAVILRDLGVGPQLENVTIDEPAAGEVLVRMAASGICGSDLHVLHGKSAAAVLPTVLGHEGSGVVEAVGPGVRRVVVGDHVVLMGDVRRDHRVHSAGAAINVYAGQGTMAELAVVSQDKVVVIPQDVPLDVMALMGCAVLTGVGTVLNGPRPDAGGSALVVGCGGVGLNIIQALHLVGAATIVAVDNNPARLNGASDFGATHVINSGERPIGEAVRSVLPNGVDVAYEVVGSPELTQEAWAATRSGGTCVMVGAAPPGSEIHIDSRQLLLTQRNLTASLMGGASAQTEIPRIIELYRAGRIKIDELVGARVPLQDFGRALGDMESGAIARALLLPSG